MGRFFSLACILALAVTTQPLAAQPVKGILTDVVKDQNTPTGSITVMDNNNKAVKFVVGEFTQFQIVRGAERRQTNFLAEHRGEMVAVFPLAKSNPVAAAKVDILLPAPPPPPAVHIVRTAPRVGHVRGTVVHIDPNTVTIRLHEPPSPVLGVVTEVGVNPDTGVGFFTINVNGKVEKFVATVATRFYKVKGRNFERGSFLSEDKGQTVVVFPMLHHHHVAAKVDIILDGPAMALHHHRYHHKHHWITFLLTPDTAYIRVRDGRHHPATLAAVQLHEEVSILPTGQHSHIARNVDILLPHQVHGVVTGLASGAIKVKVHHGPNSKHPAFDQEIVVPLAASTTVETLDPKKVRKPANPAALATGERVVVYPAGPPPHVAETVEIHLQAIKKVTVHGHVAGAGMGTVTVKVHHAAKGDKPAHDTLDTFAITMATTLEMHQGKNTVAAPATALIPGAEVTIHGHTGSPAVADKIEIKAPKKTPPKK